MAMYEKWGDNTLWMMWLSCQFQGLCQLLLSVSFIFVFLFSSTSSMLWICLTAMFVFGVGIIGECIADYQLYQFKQTNKLKRAFCKRAYGRIHDTRIIFLSFCSGLVWLHSVLVI